MKRLFNWLKTKTSPHKAGENPAPNRSAAQLRRTGGHTVSRSHKPRQAVPERQPEYVDLDPHVEGRIEEAGPGKNVLIRNRYVREDTGTHETLKILDDSMLESSEDEGFDPYNTGQFDRSRNWDKRRK